MRWRMKDKFVNIDGYGYWPSDVPFAAAGYDPNAPETEAEFQVRMNRDLPDMDGNGNPIRD